jgi:hypothetical protein
MRVLKNAEADLWSLWSCYDIKYRRISVPQGCHVTRRSPSFFAGRLKVLAQKDPTADP